MFTPTQTTLCLVPAPHLSPPNFFQHLSDHLQWELTLCRLHHLCTELIIRRLSLKVGL